MNTMLLSINWNPNPELFNLFGISIRYSNSSFQSCSVVLFVGFGSKKQGVLSEFYLLRSF